jgi:Hsp20/alpha crystallin family
MLTISGERKPEHDSQQEGYYRLERAFGAFSRSLTLPEGVDPGAVQAPARRSTTRRRPSPTEFFLCSAGCPAASVGLGSRCSTASRNGAARRNSRAITATRRGCRSRRSLVGWGAQKRPSRRISTIRTATGRAVKARYRGVCRGCGAPTAPRNGKGDAYAYCKRCHPGAIAPQWTRERIREAMRAWRARYGAAPSS